MPKISKRIVDEAEPGSKRCIIWDSKLTGFGVLILPSGVKSYIFDYRTRQGVKRRITVGQHGNKWTAEQARVKAEDYWTTVRDGQDPLGARQAARGAPTVNDMLDAYLASEAFAELSETTRKSDEGRIKWHLRPLLGRKHAHLVSEEQVKGAFRAIREGKTATDVKTGVRGRARVRGGPGVAREAIIKLKIVYNWAIRTKFLPRDTENPCRHVDVGPVGTRDAILETAEDYAAMFKAIERLETERRIRAPAADAIRLIALTGCRSGEASTLRWRHVEGDCIVLPPTAHKAGKRTGKPKSIKLPAAAQAIIARQPEGGHDDYVFAPRDGVGPMDLSHVWAKIRKEAKLPAEICLHSLRHSTGSHMAMAGAEAAQIMAALGHSQLSTVQRYIHFAKDARSALAEKAAAVAVQGMNAASTTKPKGKVFSIRKTHCP